MRRSFAGPSSSDSGAADATLAVGDKSVLVATNADLTIYDKTGRARARVDLNDFFAPSAPTTIGPIGDPRVLYDALSRRYFLTAAHDSCVNVCLNYLFLAASTSDDPATFTAADWRFGVIDGTIANGRPSGNVGDFGMLAATSNYLVLSSVRLATFTDGGVAREGPNVPARLWVIDKKLLIDGSGAKVVADFGDLRHPRTGLPLFNVAPATGDSGETVFVVSSFGRRDSGCGYVLMGLDLAATPKLSVQLVSASGQCDPAPRMPQPGGVTPLDAANPISSQPVVRAGRLWLVESIARAGAAGPVAAVRVVAIDVSAWPAPATVVSDTTLGDPDYWFSYPAIAVDKDGNVTVVFLRGNASEYASVAYAGRVADEAPGVFRSPAVLQRGMAAPNWPANGGVACQTDCVRNRWGDYLGAGTDPVDSTGWVVGQFATGTCSWGTWVAQIDWLAARVEQDTQTPRPSVGPATGPCSGSGPPSGPSGSYRLPGPFTVTFQEQLPPDTLIGQPGMAKIVFRLSGVLTDRLSDDQLRDFVAGPPRAGFARSPRYPFVLLLPAGYSPGQYELVLRLPNGEEARSPFTIK